MTNLISKLGALFGLIISIIFFSYKKGKKDSESEQIKNLVKDYETRQKANKEFDNRVVTNDMRNILRQQWRKK